MVSRGRVFFLGLDIRSRAVKSIVIDLTKKSTEFTFKEKGGKSASHSARHTQHNSLLDCHAEVWTRFPVLAAVRRRTITSVSERRQKTLTFIAEDHTQPFASYFSGLIHTFEKTTRKPTGGELRRIQVSAKQFRPLWNTELLDANWKVSRYNLGEWLVDFLCLIPIHIAVCRENRFVPLINGVLSSELERSLLGAEIGQIVNKLSFGWYESIFQSYLALMVCPHVVICDMRSNIQFRVARKGRIIDGPTIRREELFAEPSCRYFICWECHADNR